MVDAMDELILELKTKIIDALALEDVAPADIDPQAQLVGGPLGIDSIDVLELVMMLEKEYGIVVDSKEQGAKVFASLDAMASYIAEHRGAGT